jgi:hypothetical protein
MIDLLGEQEALPPPEAHIRIKVTNRNDFTIRDRYDGVPYTFKPNDQVTVTQAVANHFFGWPGDLEQRTLYMAKRRGWSTKEHVLRDPKDGPNAKSLLETYAENIILETEEMVLVPKDKAKLADDGLDIDTMPTGTFDYGPDAPARTSKPAGGMGTKVGLRKGSPVKLGGSGERRRPGRPSAKKPEPADPPLG